MISWVAIERALTSLAIFGSGLNPARVVLARQGAPRGAGPWMDIRINSVRPVGRDFQMEEDNPASTGSDGQELLYHIRGPREMLVGFRCFGDPNSVFPEAILNDMVSRSRMSSRIDLLNSAGVGLAGWGAVVPIDGVIGSTVLEPRSTVEMRAFLASDVEDFATYIQSVELENQMDNTSRIVGDYDG